MNDVILNKKTSIERCIRQIRTYSGLPLEGSPEHDQLRIDGVVLNLQRACEQVIDLGNHVLRSKKLGVPQTTRDTFRILADAGIIPVALMESMQRMTSFRNIVVHEYQALDADVLSAVIQEHLDDLLAFTECIMRQSE